MRTRRERAKAYYHRHHATDLFLDVHGRGSRAGRLAPDIDDVGARFHQLEGEGERLVGVETTASGIEGIGCDVHHSHESGRLPELQSLVLRSEGQRAHFRPFGGSPSASTKPRLS
jgi:hypothetical protein